MTTLELIIPSESEADALAQLIVATPQAARWREQLLREALPDFLMRQRWFGAKGQRIAQIAFEQASLWHAGKQDWLLSMLTVTPEHGAPHTYFLPLACAWQDAAGSIAPAAVLARIKSHAGTGVLYDALTAPSFSRALVAAIGKHEAIPFGAGQMLGIPTTAYARLRGASALSEITSPKVSGSNTALILDQKLFLKIYRRLHVGINPEVEIGRFLTDASPYAHIVPVAGFLQYQDAARTMATAVLQGSVAHQGDAWNGTLEKLEHHLEQSLARPATEVDAGFLRSMSTLGRRTAELHVALCKQTGDDAFDPEPVKAADLVGWKAQVRGDAVQTLALLTRKLTSLPPAANTQATQLLHQAAALIEPILQAVPDTLATMKSRYHGDYHLGQVLQSDDDFILIDFEGEPARPLAERRIKHCPLRDVAGMLRSFSYAAAVALDHCALRHPELQPQLARQAQTCESQTVAAFLAGYAQASTHMSCVPQDPHHTQALIRLFSLEKALYELRYELDNRPDWVSVPLSGLLQLLPLEP